MERLEIFKVVVDTIVDRLGVDEDYCVIGANLREDIGTDSLDDVELIMELEVKFGVEVEDIEIEHIQTIGDIVDFAEKKLKNK